MLFNSLETTLPSKIFYIYPVNMKFLCFSLDHILGLGRKGNCRITLHDAFSTNPVMQYMF